MTLAVPKLSSDMDSKSIIRLVFLDRFSFGTAFFKNH